MLLSNHHIAHSEASYSSVHNYNDRLVFDQIAQSITVEQYDSNFIADVACVALNRLPPRYVRYDVDMTFFLSPVELQEILEKIAKEVVAAIEYVESRNREKARSAGDEG